MCEIPDIHAHGAYPLETLPSGWANVDVFFHNTKGALYHRIEMLDLESNLLYPQEPQNLIAWKMATLLFTNHFYFFSLAAVQGFRILSVPIVNFSPCAFFKELWHLVKLPFFYVGMQFSALLGIFLPLSGRISFAKVESWLHDGKERRESEQYRKEQRPLSEVIWDGLFEANPERALFLAICMQPIGSTRDPHIQSFQVV